MSLAGTIIDIPELQIERIDQQKSLEVWASPTQRPLCKHCQHEHLHIKATHRRTKLI